MSERNDMPVVAHLSGRHKTSCAVYDPVPGPCDCGTETEVPLVRQSDAIAYAEQRVREETAALRAMLDQTIALLDRRPKSTDNMWVGKDAMPWGKQAAALVAAIRRRGQ